MMDKFKKMLKIGKKSVQQQKQPQKQELSFDQICESEETKHPSNEKVKYNVIVYQDPVSDFIIIDEEPQNNDDPVSSIHILNEKDWEKVRKKRSISFSQCGFSKLSISKSLEQGISFQTRRVLWSILANVEKWKNKINDQFGGYEKLSRTACKFDEDIDKDIFRTYPTEEHFKQTIIKAGIIDDYLNKSFLDPVSDGNNKQRLKRILRCYALIDPEVGYTQGMNYIVGALLIALYPDNETDETIKSQYYLMDQDYEPQVFYIFAHIMQDKKWREVLRPNFPKLHEIVKQLPILLSQKVPVVHAHFAKINLDYLATFTQFILTLLLQRSPLMFRKTILDLFLLEGEDVIYQVIIKLLEIMQEELLKFDTFEDTFVYIQHELILMVYKIYQADSQQNGQQQAGDQQNKQEKNMQQKKAEHLPCKFPMVLRNVEVYSNQ